MRVPKVPDHLEAEVSGRARPMRFRLAAFTDEELAQVGADYTAALIARATEQRSEPQESKPRKPRAPKAE